MFTNSALMAQLVMLAAAARAGLEGMTAQERQNGFEGFPRGTCGPVTELMGRIVLERTGKRGAYVCGSGHPAFAANQSHAWLEVEGVIVDLTHDQFAGTDLQGWVFEGSTWHREFSREVLDLCLSPTQWGFYPMAAYVAMAKACDTAMLRAAPGSLNV